MTQVEAQYRRFTQHTDMNLQRIERFAASAVLMAAMFSFVSLSSGCGSTPTHQTEASVGQQLMDLEKAHREGIISDKEYEKLKKALVKKHD
jgi:hypothetical protein